MIRLTFSFDLLVHLWWFVLLALIYVIPSAGEIVTGYLNFFVFQVRYDWLFAFPQSRVFATGALLRLGLFTTCIL